jgi:D-serine deaminase-like pyridoxal phosphate-dependent protein
MIPRSLDELATPHLLIRLDRVRSNLARMRALLAPHGGLARWRPHVKTAKVAAVLELLLEAGLRDFKCATPREARVLLELAQRRGEQLDLLVAFPHRGANLARIAELAGKFPAHRLSVLSDEPEHARSIAAAGLDVFVDLDPGMGRSGVPHDARTRIRAVVDACGHSIRGLHAYEGHIRDATAVERAVACTPLFDALCSVAVDMDCASRELITSGTPTFLEALAHAGLARLRHRVSPGIVVYWDLNSEALGIEGFSCAASVLSRVVSAPRSDRITLDAGSKSVDASVPDPCVGAVGHTDWTALRPSEEHLPLRVPPGSTPLVGALVELLPKHVCPMVNLAERCALLDGERLLQVVPVEARAHGE